MLRIFIISSLLTIGLIEFQFRQAQSQVNWKLNVSPKGKPFPMNWEILPKPVKYDESKTDWEVLSESDDINQPSPKVIWEVVSPDDWTAIPPSEKDTNPRFIPPGNLEEAEALLDSIPLKSSDFKPLLNLSHAVPTTSVLNQEEWRLIFNTISPFKYADGSGNQNHAIQLDYGLNDKFQVSGFYSEADDPLNAQITGFDFRPTNFWQVFGAAARWKFFEDKNLSLALNSSLESWTVGSGGSDSSDQKSRQSTSPNIFNDSGERVETQNFIGSFSIPVTWQTNKEWQFTFNPGISFLPPSQGEGQGGTGEFYGTNIYMSGGFLWHPMPEVGITASIAQPIGSGTNNFDRNLEYSKVPIFSWGINLHPNPRIALQGQLTNGFGATPSTALLTLPSDNRLGYSANFTYTAGAPDTPQPPLTPIQKSLSLGGLTVNTALVPPDKTSIAQITADNKGSFDTTIGFSISNILHLDFTRSEAKDVPQTNTKASTFFANDSTTSFRGSGKVVLTSPLRGAPIWSALRISAGRNIDKINNTEDGYLFVETPLTWEGNSKLAININPKLAWTGVGNILGVGIGANIQLTPGWEVVPEANIVMNSLEKSNATVALRWTVNKKIIIEAYGTTASSIIDLGQLLDAEEVRWGSRISIKL